jgi:hypothetical protein
MRTICLVTLAATPSASPVCAQAWLPAAGQGAVAVIFQDMVVHQHLLSDGESLNVGRVDSHNVMLDVTYGLTDKFALDVSLPYISARYEGSYRHPGSVLDDGSFHGTLQDFRANVRYALVTGGVAITPFVDVIVPSHRYDYWGHAAPGRRLAELQLGTYVGRVVTRGLPGAFVQARYSYGFSQEPLGIYHDRSNLDGEVGYFINPRVRVFVLTSTQYTHGGIALTRDFPNDLTRLEFLHHDQLARADLVDVGAGAQFSLTRRLDVFGSYAKTTVGRNVHSLSRGISIGLSWGLGKSGPPDPLSEQTKHQLPKCLCQKGGTAP